MLMRLERDTSMTFSDETRVRSSRRDALELFKCCVRLNNGTRSSHFVSVAWIVKIVTSYQAGHGIMPNVGLKRSARHILRGIRKFPAKTSGQFANSLLDQLGRGTELFLTSGGSSSSNYVYTITTSCWSWYDRLFSTIVP